MKTDWMKNGEDYNGTDEMKKPYPIEGYSVAEYNGGGWALKHGSETIFRSADSGGFTVMCAILSEAKRARQEAKARRRSNELRSAI